MNRRQFLTTTLAAAALAQSTLLPGKSSAAPAARPGDAMNILVLTGSPRENGNSNTLAEHFIRGATEAGHTVQHFDAALHSISPCIACNSCGMDGPCVMDDDFEVVRPMLLVADMVVLATPMYYFGISSQLKALIDRFYSINGRLHVHKKAALLMTYANTSEREAAPILLHYEVLLDYMGWEDAGRVVAPGVWTEGSVKRTKYPQMAYELGRSLKA